MSKFTIQDIFIKYGDEYIKKHNLSNEQWKVFNAIALVKNAAKNILVSILVEIDIVQCVKIMQEKNGFKKNLVIY